MAQPVFEEHPLEEYLRDSGEYLDPMPGTTPGLDLELDPLHDIYSTHDQEDAEQVSARILAFFQMIQTLILRLPSSEPQNVFIERFKYSVISSSLLAPTMTPSHSREESTSISIPGKLRTGHSRASSIDSRPSPPQSLHDPHLPWALSFMAVGFSIVTSSGHPFVAILLIFAGTVFIRRGKIMRDCMGPEMVNSLSTLQDLVTASDVWESVVQEALQVLEDDERSIPNGSKIPKSPSSSLRLALHSSLHASQARFDNVRQLLSSLAAPTELPQLSEMYAPPSPMGFNSSLPDTALRPLSLPVTRNRYSFSPLSKSDDKRATWSGVSTSSFDMNSPSHRAFRRRDSRTPILSTLVTDSPLALSRSAPTTPSRASSNPLLVEVKEEGSEESNSKTTMLPESFGTAALDLRRRRTSRGVETFKAHMPSSSISSPSQFTPHTPVSSVRSPSRFTTIQPSRHPHSIFALHHALQGVLQARRYTCSHLLALRFHEDDDIGYWEDVRSLMGLMSTIFFDSSSELTEALNIVEERRLEDMNVSPPPFANTPLSNVDDVENESFGHMVLGYQHKTPNTTTSFAPLPSEITRFAAHVDAVTAALEDAKAHLKECVIGLGKDLDSLPDDNPFDSPGAADRRTRESKALEAYDRLRRELGLALRECERGREKLAKIVSPPSQHDDVDADAWDLPALAHDGSDESERGGDTVSPYEEEVAKVRSHPDFSVVTAHPGEGALDDATAHLLLSTSSQHLPPVGVEQVFEAEASETVFTRERSKLTREERIRLAKSRRESGLSVLNASESPKKAVEVEKWGPGGEVVQELKDVIWKVGERRRKMTIEADALASESS